MRRAFSIGALASVFLVGTSLFACGADESPTQEDLPDDIDSGEKGYDGPAKGNLPPRPDAGTFTPIPGEPEGGSDAGAACCNVTFSLADTTNDESPHRLLGDFGPLAGSGVDLVWSNGKWSATACIPVGAYVRYRFYFGKVPEDPTSDGGALVDDSRYDTSSPTASDGSGGFVNTVEPAAGCSGTDAGVDSGPPPAPTATDGIRNGTETDVDCGGGLPTSAPACAAGKRCQSSTDCAASTCTGKGFCSKLGRLYAGVYAANLLQGFGSASTASGVTSASTSASVAQVGGVTLDGTRDVAYVASFADDAIYAFAPASTSSGPPARTIRGITRVWGVAVDATRDRLFAASFDGLLAVYDAASTRNGTTTASRQITGFPTGSDPYGLVYDAAADRLFVSLRGTNTIAVFDNASTASGAYATKVSRTITGAATKLSTPSQLAYDAVRDELYVANVGAFDAAQVVVFSAASSAKNSVAPSRTLTTTGYNDVSGIALDVTRDELYVSTGTQLRVPVYANASTASGALTTSRRVEGFSQFVSQLAYDPSHD